MALGLGRLKLAPRDFWQMTVYELSLALGIYEQHAQALTRAEMEKLIKASGENLNARN